MSIIKLTSYHNNEPIFMNKEMIGHFYEYKAENGGTSFQYTIVGCLSHTNGGLKVKETPNEIITMLSNL
jgi:hypothetical protein